MKFGENLYNLRKSSKMSQEKLAEKVGVSRQSISKWENGESYPEMENILKICKIFHCKINDLVHDDLQDIDSLDEEIKMNVVKLERKKQKRLKVISKIIYVIALIARIFAKIGIVCIAVAAILMGIFISSVNIKSNKDFEIRLGNAVAEYKEVNGEMVITSEGESVKVADFDSEGDMQEAINAVSKYQKPRLVAYIIVSAVFLIASLVLLCITLKHLEKLFRNIHDGNTPFTLENVYHIKRMSYFMIAVTIVSAIGEAISGLLVERGVDINIGFSIIYILFIYSIAYIFEYGYNIQQETNGRIYGDENE